MYCFLLCCISVFWQHFFAPDRAYNQEDLIAWPWKNRYRLNHIIADGVSVSRCVVRMLRLTFTLFCLGRSSARTQTPWPPGPAGRNSRRWCKCRPHGVWTDSCENTRIWRKVFRTANVSLNSPLDFNWRLSSVSPNQGALTHFSWSSWATGQSLVLFVSPGIYCSRWRMYPPNVSSCLRAQRVQSTWSSHWVAWK